MVIEELIKESVYHSPLSLLSIKDEKVIKQINDYLPYSVGIEIECNIKNYNQYSSNEDFNNKFKNIPNILYVECDSGEQRFRIPNGLQGLICLYNISNQLKIHSALNMGSGIHYHIDMTDCYNKLTEENIKRQEDYILDELSTWNYQGYYNGKRAKFDSGHNWMRFQSDFKTAEIRIGEMTFDYEVLVNRIIHANKIIKHLKDSIGNDIEPIYNYCDINLLLDYHKDNYINYEGQNKLKELQDKLKEFIEPQTNIITEEQMNQSISKRTFKVKK